MHAGRAPSWGIACLWNGAGLASSHALIHSYMPRHVLTPVTQSELRQEITASSRAVGKAIAQAKQAAAGAQAKAGGQAGGQPLAAALRLGAPASLQVAKRQKAEVPVGASAVLL